MALDLNTGAMNASWTGRGDGGTIRRAIVRGNWLYVAGSFVYINGTAHSLFARLNANTGAIDSTFKIDASVPRAGGSVFGWTLAVSPDGNTIVGGGNFTEVNGAARNQIFVAENVNGASRSPTGARSGSWRPATAARSRTTCRTSTSPTTAATSPSARTAAATPTRTATR